MPALRWLRGTTLVAPWLWAMAAILLSGLVEVAIMTPQLAISDAAAGLLRYAADVATVCPLVAVMGARRPHHWAWQFVVATLYGVLLVPALQASRAGSALPALEGPWSWFLLGLIVIGFFNGLPTRFSPAIGAFSAAQLVLLAPYLPVGAWSKMYFSAPARSAGGVALLTAAVALAWWRGFFVAAARNRQEAAPLDRLWLDFRDNFGALWALRIQERVNASAAMYQWPLELTWSGFRDRDGASPPTLSADVDLALQQSLRSLLRRFVSPKWIDQRLSPPVAA